jgi:putative MATE family efflux protein
VNKKRNYSGHVEGSILGSIYRMGLPSMIGFAASNVYDIVDIFWLSRLGVDPPAAVTFFFAFYWVISSANLIAGTGSVAVISQNFGAGDHGLTETSIKETFALKAMLGILFGAAGLVFLRPVLRLLGAEGQVLEMAVDYGTVQLVAMAFPFCAYTVYTAFRGIGNPKWAMALQIASILLNIVLDPFLIFGWWIFPEMGVVGAAWASILGFAFSVVAGLVLLYSGILNVRLHFASRVRMSYRNMMKILRIGLPSGISATSFSLSRSVVMGLVAVYGTEVVAAYGIGNRISAFGIMAIVGLSLGISALIGQILGAEDRDRAWKTGNRSILLSTAVMILFGAFCFFGADLLIGVFFEAASGDQSGLVHRAGVILLKVFAFSFPFIGIFITVEQVFTGAGKNVPAMMFNVGSNWILEIPLIVLLARLTAMGELGVWVAMTLSAAIGTLAFLWYYRRKTWLGHRVRSLAP